MALVCLLSGLGLVAFDVASPAKTLHANILRRLLALGYGVLTIMLLDKRYLRVDLHSAFYAFLVGLLFLLIHVYASKEPILKMQEINKGLIKTSVLIYLLELPSEEFLFRGGIMLTMWILIGAWPAILLSSTLFLILHIRTWQKHFVWLGSFFLALACALAVSFSYSIWSAIIIHCMNNFGYLTLVNKRNIFAEESKIRY